MPEPAPAADEPEPGGEDVRQFYAVIHQDVQEFDKVEWSGLWWAFGRQPPRAVDLKGEDLATDVTDGQGQHKHRSSADFDGWNEQR